MKLQINNIQVEDKYLTVPNDKVATRIGYYTKRGWRFVSRRPAGAGETTLLFRKRTAPEVTITP